MVGYGNNYPRQVHHRASSIVSFKVNPSFVSCRGGYATWFSRKASDPNLLMGAIVGGPDAYDNFADERDNYEQTEPATYNNAPLLGILARLHGGHGGYNQLLPGIYLGSIYIPIELYVKHAPSIILIFIVDLSYSCSNSFPCCHETNSNSSTKTDNKSSSRYFLLICPSLGSVFKCRIE